MKLADVAFWHFLSVRFIWSASRVSAVILTRNTCTI
jgi:hypothetical protein